MRFLFCAATLLVTGCGSIPIDVTDSISVEAVDFPAPDTIVTRRPGESIVNRGTRTTSPVLEILKETRFGKEEGERSIATCAITAQPGSWPKHGVYRLGDAEAVCFGPVEMKATRSDGSTNYGCPGYPVVRDICLGEDNQYFVATRFGRWYLKRDFDHLRLITLPAASDANFLQELTYDGQSNGNLRFTYKEYRGDLVEAGVIREVHHSIDESAFLEISGLQVEVISATDSEIVYRTPGG